MFDSNAVPKTKKLGIARHNIDEKQVKRRKHPKLEQLGHWGGHYSFVFRPRRRSGGPTITETKPNATSKNVWSIAKSTQFNVQREG